jgi:hypothetical protein
MESDRKAKAARILGYICVVAGGFNLVLAGILALRDQTQVAFPLLGSGAGALTVGFIVLTLGKQKPTSGE